MDMEQEWTEPVNLNLSAEQMKRLIDRYAAGGDVRISAVNYIWPPVAKMDAALVHTVRKYRIGTDVRYCVEGPNGYFRDGYHHFDHAMAEAAFWSGDKESAELHRKAFLVIRGLLKEDE
jgi:hypothetical protein